MSATRTLNPLAAAIDPVPLLGARGGGGDERGSRPSRRPSLRGAARFLWRTRNRRMMREPSMLVRETAAEQLEERQGDWAYSRPVIILDVLWNMAFVVVAVGVLFMSRDERPTMPLGLWIAGYALQCVLHMICVCVEYRRRRSPRQMESGHSGDGSLMVGSRSTSDLGSPIDLEGGVGSGNNALEEVQDEDGTSLAKHLESANTMFSFIWWIIGFYWVSAGGQVLTREAPQLYWLCIVFLAFDVFFVIVCFALACIVGIAVCCCLPCIIAILYAVADQEGASEDDICHLPKFKFRRTLGFEKLGEISRSSGGVMTDCGDPHHEIALSYENAECCICLSAYDDGAELRQLPCGHHFHCCCIDKWLRINATCPLCKYNIIKSSNRPREEV
ncbi:E3 ubiquitin-protein ligase At1g12760-like isoform X2 [Phalaenopsis equestris]|uniref:E3 ubiquitin-protein ligase At1g12760-like isoform X2 n=1 Tax=Phalaenopsis equestris TaxID=78828 RepID=UPI0009E5EA33|nr:E3 ubiquitin-protein ligase At1g12760-like isoform X2 [Phalaenopsis equestris]